MFLQLHKGVTYRYCLSNADHAKVISLVVCWLWRCVSIVSVCVTHYSPLIRHKHDISMTKVSVHETAVYDTLLAVILQITSLKVSFKGVRFLTYSEQTQSTSSNSIWECVSTQTDLCRTSFECKTLILCALSSKSCFACALSVTGDPSLHSCISTFNTKQ